MAQPQAYNREVDFTERDGDDTNHAGINAELDAAALSINQIRDNLALIQKDDGSLENGIVGAEQLAPSAFDAVKGELNAAVSDAQSAAAQSTLAANTSIAARDAALAAQAAVETANTSSALNATTASTKAAEANASAAAAAASATASGNSATASQTSRLASEAARDAAQTAQAAASASQTAAAASQVAAATSESNAATSAATATAQAGIATTQAASASASATAAAASLDSFDDRYLGPKSTAPTTDNDGNALLVGALYFDTAANEMRVFTGSVWKAIGSAVNGTTNRASYIATAGQTTFGITYDVGFVDVYLNGLKLQATVDFTATNGTSIVLATGATVGDVVDIVAYGVFTVANTYTKTEADALLALKANQATAYTKAEVDAANALKLNAANPTYSGNLSGVSASFSGGVSGSLVRGLFRKANPEIVAFTKTGSGTATTSTVLYLEINGTVRTIASGTSITMPTLTAGTDYAIWAKPDGTLEATSNHNSPPVTGARKIGGFHYAPGGNAAAMAGGNTTPQINEYSFWDLKFRPACPDPRGMTLVADGFWADIYLLGVDHLTNGTSKFNVTIADGSSPPRVPTKFGGNGTTTYTTLNWWEAREVMVHHGKRLPTYGEFAALAYGTTEATQGGTDPVSTILRNAFTSRWGVMLAAGNMWVWGNEFGGGAAGATWTANTGGRGSTYQMENAVLFGGNWGHGASCGSRCSSWLHSPTDSHNSIGARGVCDHLILD